MFYLNTRKFLTDPTRKITQIQGLVLKLKNYRCTHLYEKKIDLGQQNCLKTYQAFGMK